MKRRISYALSLLLITTLSVSCNPEKKHWEYATSSNTIDAYKIYLNTHPAGTHADSAKSKIAELAFFDWAKFQNRIPAYQAFLESFPNSPFSDSIRSWEGRLWDTRHPEFKHVKNVRMTFRLDFEEMEKATFGIDRIAKKIMANAGLRLVEDRQKEADADFHIEVKGKALRASYFSANDQYTGAELSGTLSFITSKGFVYEMRFKGRIDPPSLTVIYTRTGKSAPNLAPWAGALGLRGSYDDRLLDMVKTIFGSQTLIYLLSDIDLDLAKKARDKILEMNDPNTIELLLNIINNYKNAQSVEYALNILDRFNNRETLKFINTIGPLYQINRGEDARLVANAAYILGELKESRAVESLISALENHDESVRNTIVSSLKKITGAGEGFYSNQAKWQTWWKENKEIILKKR